jgi:hypothetical protein
MSDAPPPLDLREHVAEAMWKRHHGRPWIKADERERWKMLTLVDAALMALIKCGAIKLKRKKKAA